ncbi:hypothetical protein ACTXT7_006965 [Hymenolepis weldensis]
MERNICCRFFKIPLSELLIESNVNFEDDIPLLDVPTTTLAAAHLYNLLVESHHQTPAVRRSKKMYIRWQKWKA